MDHNINTETRRAAYVDPNTGKLWVLSPASFCGLSFEQVCQRDVPAGLPYVVIQESDLPIEHQEFWDAWEIDLSNPDGYGIGIDAWNAQQEAQQ